MTFKMLKMSQLRRLLAGNSGTSDKKSYSNRQILHPITLPEENRYLGIRLVELAGIEFDEIANLAAREKSHSLCREVTFRVEMDATMYRKLNRKS